MKVIYYIGFHKKTKECKDETEANQFCIYLKNLWGLVGTIEN